MRKVIVATRDDLEPGTMSHAQVEGVDLVVVRWPDGEGTSVLYGRCRHRGALLADGTIEGSNIICSLHRWDYCYKSGISSYLNDDRLHRFSSFVEDGEILVDADEIRAWLRDHPQPWDRGAYQGNFQDPHGAPEEPHTGWIHELAANGLSHTGHHGEMAAMGVPRDQLPGWDDLQILTAQLHRLPLLDDESVDTRTTIGPSAARPLELKIPLFVTDMSFGALSEEAKVALARGAEAAGTGICSGEGGMLPEEQAGNRRYLYELASARFGFSVEKMRNVQAFHFKCGQGAKTGTGGHLPGTKVKGKIAEVRGLPEGTPAVSPARFPEFESVADFRALAEEVREVGGGLPIGFKLSAQHIERDIDAALEATADYIILDGRGGGTGAAPLLFRDHISVPTIPAIARARRHLDALGRRDVSLIATGGLRTAADFVKALALGADAVALGNSALQAIGCLGMRACHTNNCPVGIATQKPHLRARLPVDEAAERLTRFLHGATDLMCVLARACGHRKLSDFSVEDLTSFDRKIAELAGVHFAGIESR